MINDQYYPHNRVGSLPPCRPDPDHPFTISVEGNVGAGEYCVHHSCDEDVEQVVRCDNDDNDDGGIVDYKVYNRKVNSAQLLQPVSRVFRSQGTS